MDLPACARAPQPMTTRRGICVAAASGFGRSIYLILGRLAWNSGPEAGARSPQLTTVVWANWFRASANRLNMLSSLQSNQ
ncbi:UNVERIFIED_CONTAM: hypothetical protein Sangu_1017200 [Sesamum angustifolium]|uniref:Uncharacterized protein n=1 Tax=Sesamum angustifolium TaxID=2727405 RepID=A0AAW2NWE0_9LAMI